MVIDFFCSSCRLDQKLLTFKRQNRYGSSYTAKCEECEQSVWRFPDMKLDPYFVESIKLKKERYLLKDDLVQPGDPRFKLLCKEQFDKMEKETFLKEEKVKQDLKDKDEFIRKSGNRKEAIALLNAEENFDHKLNG